MKDAEGTALDRLIKLLKMTTSSSDGEALVAMRKANEKLSELGGDWEKLLRGKVTVIADPFANVPVPEAGRRQMNTPPPPPPSFVDPAAAFRQRQRTQAAHNPPPRTRPKQPDPAKVSASWEQLRRDAEKLQAAADAKNAKPLSPESAKRAASLKGATNIGDLA